ncbi:phage terminase small subunit P27 family [Rhizobium leguminosarum]|uniref:phage terminase small subunit P27 family n=1 Tax=Rhizobium indicum TaxID=2583231 RepID=UPI001106CECC|nr:phage terminase small subunit P27 family [Rhizobium indicum]QKK28893.1 phage terminase small subunit P27 family [Rhizobium indicum]
MTRGLKPSTIVPGSSPVTGIPKTPSYLNKEAKAEWRRVAPILALERKVLTDADLATLETYCVHYGALRMAEREIAANGLISDGKRNPAYGILKESSLLLVRCAGELGLTPSARSRASMNEYADDDEGFV